ncbi:hypothetical protein DPMN_186395 [Dreissena polymorpha]|uniref:Exonuclease domain-containing protein n=1 Tax=Dreissena polymorpha TaxID=45954 RepID=A0A9D4DQC1_DREPO|nr:hypothetical protein DPMN_186395 [Dreissena polymorpha]
MVYGMLAFRKSGYDTASIFLRADAEPQHIRGFQIMYGIQRTVQEVRAGPTYSSNIEDHDVEVTTIPPPIPKPGPAGLDTTGKEFVFFDLETRGLEHTSHIIQIAAVHSTGQFSTYVIHEKKISLQASVTVVSDSSLAKGQRGLCYDSVSVVRACLNVSFKHLLLLNYWSNCDEIS